jgi:hypothetical protein
MAHLPGYRLRAGLAVLLTVAAATAMIAAPASAATNLVTAFGRSQQSGSEPVKQAEAACPADRQVLGGGADIVGGAHGVRVSGMAPDSTRHTLIVVGTEDANGYDGSWTITAFAVCGTVTGYEVVRAATLSAPGESDVSAQADCPSGKKVIGAGGLVRSDVEGHVVLDDVMPDFDLSGVTVEAMHDGTPQSPDETFPVFAYAICASPQPAQQMVFAQTAAGPGDKIATVACPSGTQVHGAGAGLSGAYGQAHLDRIGLNGVNALGGTDVDARQDLDGTTENWSAWAFAICAG